VTTQPKLGQLLEQIRKSERDENGKRLNRNTMAEKTGLTVSAIANIEKGRELKDGELEKLLAAYPMLGQAAFLPDEPAKQEQHGNKPAAKVEESVDTATDVDESIETVEELRAQGYEVMDLKAWVHGYGDLVALDAALENDVLDDSPMSDAAVTYDFERSVDATQTLENLGGIPPIEAGPATVVEPETPVPAVEQPEITPLRLDGTIAVSNSEVQTFKRCRRKWWLSWYRGLAPKFEEPVGAAALGARVHRALRALYVPAGQTPQDPRDALERAITDDWTKLALGYKEQGYDAPPEGVVKRFQDDTALERKMVEGYIEWLAEEGADRGLRVVAPETYVEAKLDIPAIERGVLVIGKLDVRLIRESDGVRLFMDHKTVGDLTSPVKTLHLDEQMLHYHLIEWLQAVEDGRCDGAIYNMLRKVKRTMRANPPFFGRVEVRHNPIELESFKKRLVGTIMQMVRVREQLDAGKDPLAVVYPTPNRNCSWDCDHFAICPLFDDGSRVDDMIASRYREQNPLSYYLKTEEE
jgi:transcriptional regulator with XRE-family HTH domain